MADIPNRLPAPEKRKDKITKNDMRYLYRMDKAKQKSKRRAVIDSEIENEQKAAAKKRRQSVTNARQITRAANKKAEEKKGRKNLTDEQLLLQASRNVCAGTREIPCFFEDFPETSENMSEPPMTIEEIVKIDSNAIIWNELDYGHFIVHPNLWVFCAACHLGMRSTNIGKIQYCPVLAQPPPDTTTRTTASVFNSVFPAHRWVFYHANCKKRDYE